jgi:hypothetical protein
MNRIAAKGYSALKVENAKSVENEEFVIIKQHQSQEPSILEDIIRFSANLYINQ